MDEKKAMTYYKKKMEYNKEYVIQKCKQVTLMLNRKTDADIINYLETVGNKNAFLKSLIRAEMQK